MRSTQSTEGDGRVNQYLGAGSRWAVNGSRDQKHLILALPSRAQVLTPSGTHQASCWVCPASSPQALELSLNGEYYEPRQPSSALARGCAWKTVKHKSAQGTRPLGEPGQKNNLATSTCQITKQQIHRKSDWCWKAYQVPTWKLCLTDVPWRYSKNPG